VFRSTPTASRSLRHRQSRLRARFDCDTSCCYWPHRLISDRIFTSSASGFLRRRAMDTAPRERSHPAREIPLAASSRPEYTESRLRGPLSSCIGNCGAELAARRPSFASRAKPLPVADSHRSRVFFAQCRQPARDSFHLVAWGNGERRIVESTKLAGGIHDHHLTPVRSPVRPRCHPVAGQG